MYCPKCGTEIKPGLKSCASCGLVFSQELLEKIEKERQRSLVARAKAGDQEAIAQLYEENYAKVLFAIRSVVRDEDTALDLLQDAFLKAFRKIDQLEDDAGFTPWVKVIAVNSAKDYVKRKKPELFSDMKYDSEEEDESFENTIKDERSSLIPEEALEEAETQRLINDIVYSLPEDQRITVTLFYYEQMSVKEISNLMEVSESAVKSRLAYGRKKIEKKVRELEKKGTKLYGLAPVPFLMLLWKNMDAQAAEIVPKKEILSSVLGAVSESAADAASSAAAGTAEEAASAVGKGASETAGIATSAGKETARKAAKETAKAAGKGAARAAAKSGTAGKAAAVITAAAVGAGGTAAYVASTGTQRTLIYAQTVESFTSGIPWTEVENAQDPDSILGEPDWDEEAQSGFLNLGGSGEIILSFGEAFTDTDGDDIVIYEAGDQKESVDVYVSEDGAKWYDIGIVKGGTDSIDMEGLVPEDTEFMFIRIIDNEDSIFSRYPGADIDAVAVYVLK